LHVGQSLGSFRIEIISRMKTFLVIFWIYFTVNWHPAILFQTSNRFNYLKQNVRYSIYFLIWPINSWSLFFNNINFFHNFLF
jgi:hypothetical protein